MRSRAFATILITLVITLASANWMHATVKYPAETKNAALRYWMAFAEMQDTWADKTTQELLEKTAAGDAAWDESKLAPILDANADAIGVMQRATKLPECDWGLEYGRGWKASIAYAPRARACALEYARGNAGTGEGRFAVGRAYMACGSSLFTRPDAGRLTDFCADGEERSHAGSTFACAGGAEWPIERR